MSDFDLLGYFYKALSTLTISDKICCAQKGEQVVRARGCDVKADSSSSIARTARLLHECIFAACFLSASKY
jgi:nitrogenase subunit NifH